jgi:coenzyme F420 hydrogenase subunit beta
MSSNNGPSSAVNPHVVNQVVDVGLCVRCGACEPACPVDIIRFDDAHYPVITDEEKCIVGCTRCIKVCPGDEVDFTALDRQMFGRSPHPDSITGIVRNSYVSFANDEKVRASGSSGGFVTQLLTYLIEKGEIDGALVLGTSADENGWHEQPLIARTVEELRRCQASKYMIAPVLKPLGEMERIEGRYAVVGVPCYVHALRNYLKVSPKLRQRLKLIIGLYCNVALEPHLFADVCEMKGVTPRDVTSLDFRFGQWPGGVHATLRDGRVTKVLKHEEMKDEFNTLKLFYTPPRCNMCVDFSAEYADLAVGDPWLRGPDGQYLYTDGRTTVLTRTAVGQDVLDRAVADGYISVEPIPIKTYMVNFEKTARYKRDMVPKNIELRRRLGLAVPEYHRQIGTNGHGNGHSASVWSLRKAVRANLLHLASRWKFVRKLGVRLAQTPPALAYFRWNRGRKARKFAAGYGRMEAFVDKLLRETPPPLG